MGFQSLTEHLEHLEHPYGFANRHFISKMAIPTKYRQVCKLSLMLGDVAMVNFKHLDSGETQVLLDCKKQLVR